MTDEDWDKVREYASEKKITVTRDGEYGFYVSATNIAGGSQKTKSEPVKFTDLAQARAKIDSYVEWLRKGGGKP